MERINFRKQLIEYFVLSYKTFQLTPSKASEDKESLIEDIKNIDCEKGEITQNFVKSLMTLYTDDNKSSTKNVKISELLIGKKIMKLSMEL